MAYGPGLIAVILMDFEKIWF